MSEHKHHWGPYDSGIKANRCLNIGCRAVFTDKGGVIEYEAETPTAHAPAAPEADTPPAFDPKSGHSAVRKALATGGPLIRGLVAMIVNDHDEHRQARIVAESALQKTRDEIATVRSAANATLGAADSLQKRLAEANERIERVLFYLAKPTVWNVSRAIRAARGEDVGPPSPSPEGTPQPFAIAIPSVVEPPGEAAPEVTVHVKLSGESLRGLLSGARQLSSIDITTCQQHGIYILSTVEHPKPEEPTT